MREVRRVLAPDGVFIFSTRNRDSRDYSAWFMFPRFEFSFNPVVLGVRSARYILQTGQRVFNRLRYRSYELRAPTYAMINDVYHQYRVMLYFITLPFQLEQLRQAGFKDDARAYDQSGALVAGDSSDGTLTLVVEKT